MNKILIISLIGISFLNADFPTYDEVFNGKKKTKTKVIYVNEKNERISSKKVIGPTKNNKYYYNPISNEKKSIDKRKPQYPANKNNVKYYKNADRSNVNTNLRGTKALKQQASQINPYDIKKQAGRVDFNSGKKDLKNKTNSINPTFISKKVNKKKKNSLDAVDKLHIMARCEAEAKTNKEKEACWNNEASISPNRNKNKEIQLKKEKELEQKMRDMNKNNVMDSYNKLYKDNKYYKNPLVN